MNLKRLNKAKKKPQQTIGTGALKRYTWPSSGPGSISVFSSNNQQLYAISKHCEILSGIYLPHIGNAFSSCARINFCMLFFNIHCTQSIDQYKKLLDSKTTVKIV